MSKDVTLKSFPSNRSDALTMLYLQNQDLTGKSPEEIVKLFLAANEEVRETFSNAPRQKVSASVKTF